MEPVQISQEQKDSIRDSFGEFIVDNNPFFIDRKDFTHDLLKNKSLTGVAEECWQDFCKHINHDLPSDYLSIKDILVRKEDHRYHHHRRFIFKAKMYCIFVPVGLFSLALLMHKYGIPHSEAISIISLFTALPGVIWVIVVIAKILIEEKREEKQRKNELIVQGRFGSITASEVISAFLQGLLPTNYPGATDIQRYWNANESMLKAVCVYDFWSDHKQTAGHDVKDALLSGALGSPVPILGGDTFKAKLISIVLTPSYCFLVRMGELAVDEDGQHSNLETTTIRKEDIYSAAYETARVKLISFHNNRIKIAVPKSEFMIHGIIELTFSEQYVTAQEFYDFIENNSATNKKPKTIT